MNNQEDKLRKELELYIDTHKSVKDRWEKAHRDLIDVLDGKEDGDSSKLFADAEYALELLDAAGRELDRAYSAYRGRI